MSLLSDHTWKTSYNSDDLSLVSELYVPALDCAVRYDRATGYFSARALSLAVRGVEGLVRNNGKMRLLVGCTLSEPEVHAIEQGETLRDTIEARYLKMPVVAENAEESEALELLSWMIAKGIIEVKVAVPCDANRKPCPADGIFHDKSGIIWDKTGDRLAFNGSVNETRQGWQGNWERLTVYWDYGEGNSYVENIGNDFENLWENRFKRALVIDVPEALAGNLLEFLPDNDQKPKRLDDEESEFEEGQEDANEERPLLETSELQQLVWGMIRHSPARPNGGERVGETTSVLTPWPHQVRAFERMYNQWPPRLLIADEVGLGKTIEAGLVLRQAWLAGRANRILVLAPKAILTQWQIELREKFNLNWPIYDGQKLTWYETRALGNDGERKVDRTDWHREPFVLTSSQLMRRRDRARELTEDAEPWDLVVLDEAHHARRRGAGGAKDRGANQLLSLMRTLRERTQALLLLTATPMQVHPVEVWDLLDLLGLPPEWNESAFVEFFDKVSVGNPSHDDYERLASLFQAVEASCGPMRLEDAQRFVDGGSRLKTKKLLKALRDPATNPRRKLDAGLRKTGIRIMKANTPVSRLISRHTRGLLRRYFQAGAIDTPIADRDVRDDFVKMTTSERDLYEAVENYISSTYNAAAVGQRNAVGFVMTIYRRRLASSFAALEHTLQKRMQALDAKQVQPFALDEDLLDDDLADEAMDTSEAEKLEQEALKGEERSDIEYLLAETRKLPTDTKAEVLLKWLKELQGDGYRQVMVFTQYTDTLEFLREYLREEAGLDVLCFSGRGGELPNKDGSWRVISRDDTKRIFKEGKAEILLCTDAAAEGLNFQFCGALVNYDMPWNPMKVEQRIGRIDRLGQQFANIRITNLHYDDTVETDVYRALRERIGLFQDFVGKLQPILARLPKAIESAALAGKPDRDRHRAQLVSDLDQDVRDAEAAGFDLDEVTEADLEMPLRPRSLYDLDALDRLIRKTELLPPGVEVELLGPREYSLSMPGMSEPLRVTTDPAYFDEHPGSTELWSPGSPLFPAPEEVAAPEELAGFATLDDLVEKS